MKDLDTLQIRKLYRKSTNETKEVLDEIFGKDFFEYDWKEITSYGKACEVLGIRYQNYTANDTDRIKYTAISETIGQLLTICEAINGEQGCYNENGESFSPNVLLYSLDEMNEEYFVNDEKIDYDICRSDYYDNIGCVCCDSAYKIDLSNGQIPSLPILLNSYQKAEFVAKQFKRELCLCHGVKIIE